MSHPPTRAADGHITTCHYRRHTVCAEVSEVELAAGKSEVNLHALCLLKIVLGPTP